MKELEFGLLCFTRRPRYGRPVRVAMEPALLRKDYRPACNLVSVLTSRPIFPGAMRRQLVPAGQFLNLSRLGRGLPADSEPLAKAGRETLCT